MLQILEYMMKDLNNNLLKIYDKYMYLKIFIDDIGDNGYELKNKYLNAVEKHNNNILISPRFVDAGFDLFAVDGGDSLHNSFLKVDFKVICSAQMIFELGKKFNTGYYMYPRSSLSKTKFRLANSTGIIDAGYRGHLIGAFDVLEESSFKPYDKLLQICAPGLVPIIVKVVDDVDELGERTERGTGGFGSTGR
jgi:dUTPase